jgi:hypothetical protein
MAIRAFGLGFRGRYDPPAEELPVGAKRSRQFRIVAGSFAADLAPVRLADLAGAGGRVVGNSALTVDANALSFGVSLTA